MDYTYKIVKTEENQSVAVTAEGQLYIADGENPNYDAILHGVVSDTPFATLRDLFDITKTIGTKFEHLSERVTVANGMIFFDGNPVHGAIIDQILRFVREGDEDYKALVLFYEKIQTNPNEHSREHLYAWLDSHDFTIADDGDFYAYKGLATGAPDYLSQYSGKAIVDGVVVKGQIPNRPGSTIEMPRDEVVFDPGNACSVGLHAANWGFAKGYGKGAMVKLKVNPRDVVSVPNLGDKMRVCRYYVVEELDEPMTGAYAAFSLYEDYGEDDDDYEPYDDDGDDDGFYDPFDESNDSDDEIVDVPPTRIVPGLQY